ncbi:MAG: pitrilysin family protein [Pseudomonadota bacterium]
MGPLTRLLTLAAACFSTTTIAAEVTTGRLDNGLEIVVIEDHRAPVVVHMLWYKIGAADEPPGKSGIAHFVEHLLFKATDTLEAGEFSEIVSANGGRDNAFTSWDYTGYFQRVSADRLGLMMSLEADRMRNIRLTENDIVTERDVILEERAQRTDSNPGALFSEQTRAAQYLNHPYGIPIIGWRHEMETLNLEDALDFYETFYAPNNAILIVAGDVEPEDVVALAEEHYGPIAPTPDLPVRALPQEPPQLAERRVRFSDPRVAQPYVVRTMLAPERDSGAQETAAALTLLAEVLGGSNTTSFLAQRLQFESQKAVYTSAFYSGTSLDDTTFGLVVVPSEGRSLDEAEADLDEAIAAFLEEGIDTDQFERIKMRIRASEIYAQDSTQSLARRYGVALTSGLTVDDVAEWPAILQAVTPEEVMAVATLLTDRTRAVTGFFDRADTPTAEATQ